ncbi:universal stress protein [Planosporangium sp. 12N6]|uniref:universal stress protein n=1 Tax=Planosporangium spinosum TaxID=3402278 RepID=UPI003CED4D9E
MTMQAGSAGPETSPREPMPVVAGVDGSPTAFAAAEYAAGEAQRRDVPLTLVHGFTWPLFYPPLTGDYHPTDPLPRTRAGMMLTNVAERIRLTHPDLTVAVEVLDGHAAGVLVDLSRHACLVVVGHRGEGGFAGLLAGSVAVNTATHAHCPVVVVRGTSTKTDASVVAGVDGSAGAHRAIEFAFDEAARRGAPLTAVGVWPSDRGWPDALTEHGYPTPSATDQITADIADCAARYPQVQVLIQVVRGRSPAGALATAAEGASLVVVGSRGRGGLRGLLLGSVGRALIEHAPCPVAIVRPAD